MAKKLNPGTTQEEIVDCEVTEDLAGQITHHLDVSGLVVGMDASNVGRLAHEIKQDFAYHDTTHAKSHLNTLIGAAEQLEVDAQSQLDADAAASIRPGQHLNENDFGVLASDSEKVRLARGIQNEVQQMERILPPI